MSAEPTNLFDLKRAAEKLSQALAAASTEHQLCTVLQNDPVFVMKPGLQFSDTIDVYDG